jgi:hypothetical protein
MTDEEFSVPEIKKLYLEKLSELATHGSIKNIEDLSRTELIKTISTLRAK